MIRSILSIACILMIQFQLNVQTADSTINPAAIVYPNVITLLGKQYMLELEFISSSREIQQRNLL